MRNFVFALLLIPSTAAAQAESGDSVKIEYAADDADPSLGYWSAISGVPDELVQAEVGFSTARIAYLRAMGDRWSLGGMVGFDYAYWTPDDAFGASLLLAAPLRVQVIEERKFSALVKLEPGLYFGLDQPRFSQFILGVLLNAGVSAGYELDRSLIIGGGIDVPMVFGAPTGGRDVYLAVPFLIGPMAEYRLADRWKLTADLKAGAHFITDDYYGTRFAFRFLVGAARAL